MSDLYKRPYVESSVFIAFIKGEMQGPNRDQNAKEIFDSIIDAAKAGFFKIVTSSLTIAEVFKNKSQPELTTRENEDLRPYFREDYIVIVEIDREVGERANALCRTMPADAVAGFKALRPNDAIHIAAAERAECDVVLAWDPGFMSQQPRISSVQLQMPEKLIFTAPAEQRQMLYEEPIESAQQQIAAAETGEIRVLTETPTQLQLVGATEPDNTTREAAENPASVQGGDSGRAQSEAAGKGENKG